MGDKPYFWMKLFNIILMNQLTRLVLLISLLSPWILQSQTSIPSYTEKMDRMEGYFDLYYDEVQGKLYLEVSEIGQEFLYVNSLAAGVGSNDIGLDRNQLGGTRVVKFYKSGPQLLLVQPNYDYRAVSDNPEETKSVRDAFASSVIWGFKIVAADQETFLVDVTSFLLRDAHGVANRIARARQGSYKADASRSVLYMENTKNFPLNTEMEAMVTFSGSPQGGYIRSVVPTPELVTVRMHHSFVALPDDDYQPRVFDPRSGYYSSSYSDYATPIDQPLVKRFITRHRLEKKDPNAAVSEPIEPIVYYLDRGAPEPIKSALIEGASWWNQAFEAAGYKNAFIVKELPEGADPLDVRYNVINWVHRSTRGWSYGSSVTDPRTGEIIKGHVLLGSLRVRQDFLIAQGLVEAYENGVDADPRLLEMALARLRQLSAHEVGHTIGLSHNFAASYNDRASVMDYPHPLVLLNEKGEMDFSKAYDTGIGDWDKRTIIYGYQDFPEGTDEEAALLDILATNHKMGLQYLSDQDARPAGGAHPLAHLWDNGESAAEELRRLSSIRAAALNQFGAHNIPLHTPMATLENVLAPLFLAHRYQVEAAAKVIGGVVYTYAANGDGQPVNEMVDDEQQRDALDALLSTLDAAFLTLPESIIKLIPPQPIGYSKGRELFKTYTGVTFDPVGAAESAALHSIQFLLHPQRMARLVEQASREKGRLGMAEVLEQLFGSWNGGAEQEGLAAEVERMVEKVALHHLLALAGDTEVMQQVAAIAHLKISELEQAYKVKMNQSAVPSEKAHFLYLSKMIARFYEHPGDYKVPSFQEMPDGSPIGMACFDGE